MIGSAARAASRWLALVALGAAVGIASPPPTAADTQVVAVSGDPAPDGNGSFADFASPRLNDAAQAAFFATISGTTGGTADDAGIFRADHLTQTQIAREGQAVPGGVLSLGAGVRPVLNDLGLVVFRATRGGEAGIFRGDGTGLATVVFDGDAAPDGNGEFKSIFSDPVLNGAGQTAFTGELFGTSGVFDQSGVFRGEAGAGPTQIVRGDASPPEGSGIFREFDTAALNASGQAAFVALLSSTPDSNDSGIYRGSGGTLVQIAREGQAAPDANGFLGEFNDAVDVAINDGGAVAFGIALTGTSGGITDNTGLFVGSGGALTQLAREGQAAPDGNGAFARFFEPALNNTGQAAFGAELRNSSGGFNDDEGIFLATSSGVVGQIVRGGEPVPDGNGRFAGLASSFGPALNDAGQLAFEASLVATSGFGNDDYGIFFFDDGAGLLEVVREGDALLGSTVTVVFLSGSLGARSHESSGLNELGQVAYFFALADGRQGIAIWTAPDPTSPTPTPTPGGATTTPTPVPTPTVVLPPHVDEQDAAKVIDKCAGGIAKAAGGMVGKRLKGFEQCADGLFKCLQTKEAGAKRDTCVSKASAKCTKGLDKRASEGAKVTATFGKRCGAAADTDLTGAHGLGFGAVSAACTSRFGLPVDDAASAAACVRAHHECTADMLFAHQMPRARRLLVDAGVAAPDCLLGGGGSSLDIGDTATGKALEKCQKAIKKAGTKLVTSKLKSLQKCVDVVLGCVQLKSDPARFSPCLAKARGTCDKGFGKITAAAEKLGPAIDKKCVDVGGPLFDTAGIDLAASAAVCAAHGVAALDTLDDYVECLFRQHACLVEDLIAFETPRAAELLALVGRDLGIAFCPAL